ncbi:hypothetical protein ZIOFF_022646 [Zingiber officinale]|uniref:Uncharacterized protein n=1 Tax=Zingiber officinale TaxID=94328 RepID=A0A8J5HDI9_ZINOF|nr:hypothetical protein ZIOFF_022646 [Zingiber officinale]
MTMDTRVMDSAVADLMSATCSSVVETYLWVSKRFRGTLFWGTGLDFGRRVAMACGEDNDMSLAKVLYNNDVPLLVDSSFSRNAALVDLDEEVVFEEVDLTGFDPLSSPIMYPE